MKRIFIGLLLALVVATPVNAYVVQRGDTLSKVSSRFGMTWQELWDLNKDIENPNLIYPGQELDTGGDMWIPELGVTPLDVVALYEDNLQNTITTSDTSLTLVRGTDKSGSALSGTFGFIIDEGTTLEEFIIGTCAGTACTSLQRGISVTDGKTEVTALKKAHRKGASIKMTNYPILGRLNRILSGQDSTGTTTWKWGGEVNTTPLTLYFSNGTATNPFLRYNGTNWQFSDDGISSTNLVTGGGGLTASTTAGIGITDSKIYVNASSTTGMAFDTDGALYQKTQSATGVESDSNGVKINTSTLTNLIATSTPTASKIPMANSSGELHNDWIDEGNLNTQPFIAGETIDTSSTPQAVYFSTSTGQVLKTDADAVITTFGFIGFAQFGQTITSGNAINVQTDGLVYGFTGLTTGTVYYVSNVTGGISTSAGTNSYKIGRAISPTTLLIERGLKVISGTMQFTATATTIINTGFQASRVRIHAIGDGASSFGSQGGWSVNGGNDCISFDTNGTVTNAIRTDAWYTGDDATVYHTGAITATDSTVSFVNTETSNSITVDLFYEIEG